MTKRRMIEVLTSLWCDEQRKLDAYRLTAGPPSWGICPPDPRASGMLGRVEGIQKAILALKAVRGGTA